MNKCMKKLRLLMVLLTLLLAGQVQAQEYGTALGVRISPFWGVTAKHFFSSTDAVEGILHSRWNAFKLTGLWERHTPAFGEAGLNFYYGGGAHFGVSGNRYYNDRFASGGRIIVGVDGILGLEYTIQDSSVPLNFSVDWKPAVDFSPFANFWGSEVGISARYTFR